MKHMKRVLVLMAMMDKFGRAFSEVGDMAGSAPFDGDISRGQSELKLILIIESVG